MSTWECIIATTISFSDVVDLSVCKNDLYLLKRDNVIEKISLLPITSLIKKLQDLQHYQLCAQLALAFPQTLLASLKQFNHSLTSTTLASIQASLMQQELTELASSLDGLIATLQEEESALE